MRIYSKMLAVVCAMLMVVLAFQSVSGGEDNNGKDVDVFIDYKGNQHKVWREEVNGIYQAFYSNKVDDNNHENNHKNRENANGNNKDGRNRDEHGHNGIQITNSSLDVIYPQVAVDPVSNICYVLWMIEIGDEGNNRANDGDNHDHYGIRELWYCGSQDFVNWTDARYGGLIPSTTGNPTLDMSANNYTLFVTWKHGGELTIVPDLDGDFIPDIDDANPFVYNVVGE